MSNSGKGALIGVLSVLFVSILVIGLLMPANQPGKFKHHLFQEKGNEPYAMGTYDEAVVVVNKILAEPGFSWLGESHGMAHGMVSGDNDNFSEFDIEYHKVHMQLSYKDYAKYLKYLKTLDQTTNEKLLVSSPPWRQ